MQIKEDVISDIKILQEGRSRSRGRKEKNVLKSLSIFSVLFFGISVAGVSEVFLFRSFLGRQ